MQNLISNENLPFAQGGPLITPFYDKYTERVERRVREGRYVTATSYTRLGRF